MFGIKQEGLARATAVRPSGKKHMTGYIKFEFAVSIPPCQCACEVRCMVCVYGEWWCVCHCVVYGVRVWWMVMCVSLCGVWRECMVTGDVRVTVWCMVWVYGDWWCVCHCVVYGVSVWWMVMCVCHCVVNGVRVWWLMVMYVSLCGVWCACVVNDDCVCHCVVYGVRVWWYWDDRVCYCVVYGVRVWWLNGDVCVIVWCMVCVYYER